MEQTIQSNVKGSFDLKYEKSAFDDLFDHRSIAHDRRLEQRNSRFWLEV